MREDIPIAKVVQHWLYALISVIVDKHYGLHGYNRRTVREDIPIAKDVQHWLYALISVIVDKHYGLNRYNRRTVREDIPIAMVVQHWLYALIEEFPIIGFYLYHVTSAGQSSNWTTSGI